MNTEVDKRKGIIHWESIHRFYRFGINKAAKENAGDAIVEGSENIINGTSYDARQLYQTQPSSHITQSTVEGMKETIRNQGPNAIEPIPVRVHNGQTLIVDGHHRYQAFLELGYDRVPIKYIHENQISTYGRILQDLLNSMFK